MKLDFKIDGMDQVLSAMERLKRPSARKRLATASLKGALDIIGKQMKKDLSPRVKLGRSAVKSRVDMKFKSGLVTAKVGFGVGKRRKKTEKQKLAQSARKQKRGKRPGVGIGANNVSWWIAGTKERRTGFRRRGGYRMIGGQRAPSHSTGRMPANQPGLAWNSFTKVRSQASNAMAAKLTIALAKEVKRQST